MSLQQIVLNQDKKFQTMLKNFEAEFDTFTNEAKRRLKVLFSQGVFDKETIAQTFAESGYDDLINAWVDNYPEVISFNRQIAEQIGAKFILTEDAISRFDILQNMDFDKLKINQDVYMADMQKMAYQYNLEGKSFKSTAFDTMLDDSFSTFKRRAGAEAYTGISIADANIKLDWYNNAGITKYEYFGPEDGKTRDECLSTLTDPRQQTGWTMEEINASQTPFMSRGGWNCRHEWIPFVGG